MRRFLPDFAIAVIALPLATWAAAWFSFQFLYIGGWGAAVWLPLGLLALFGPILWLPIYYGAALVWVLLPAFRGRLGRPAAALLCLAGWASYAEYQSIRANIEAGQIAEANRQIRPVPGIDAVAFYNTICDANCTELLAERLVKTVYLESRTTATHVLTLSTDGPCEGASALASMVLRDNNGFDLCIHDETVRTITGGGLLFEDASELDRDFYGTHRSIRTFTVRRWIDGQWQRLYERKYGDIYVMQYFPVFLSGFTDTGWVGTDWWRRTITVGQRVDMRDVISDALGVKLTGSFDNTVVQRRGPAVIAKLNVTRPAPPAQLAADIERMSKDSDPAVLRLAAQSINRFVKENKTYEPVRAALGRLLAHPGPEVKASAYRAIAYEPLTIDDQLLKVIMANVDWQASALGDLLRRLGEDQLKPYEAQIITAYFDTDRVNDRHHGPKGRETLARAVIGLRLDALKQIFDRCSDISEAALDVMGDTIAFDNQRMLNATMLKLKATWAPCVLHRMAGFNPSGMQRTARALAWMGDGPAAAAEIEGRLAAPRPSDTEVDKSNLRGDLAWLRQFQADFEKRWANSAEPPH